MRRIITIADTVGPKDLTTKTSVKSPDQLPHTESTYGIDTIHENAYAIKKKENKGCFRITCGRCLEVDVD
jgi:hypothetical protein